MAEQTFEAVLDEALARVRQTLIKKNADYGPGNIALWGALGVGVRLSDKTERLRNLLLHNRTPNNESIADTALDIAGYGVILMLLLDGTWGLPSEQNPSSGPGL